MLRIQNYVQAKTLDEAYELLKKNPKNKILGGMIWLKMEDILIPTAIDLSLLELDQIQEDENEFKIGAMVSLRDLEINEALNNTFNHIFKDALKGIVGVQMRNMATIGGSVYSRFGFSDVVTCLLALECEVELYNVGRMTLEEFVKRPYQNDLLTHIYIKKTNLKSAFVCVRKSATDISTLNGSITKYEDHYKIVIGSRPNIAKVYEVGFDALDFEVEVGDNMRASKEYREQLVEAFKVKLVRKVNESC